MLVTFYAFEVQNILRSAYFVLHCPKIRNIHPTKLQHSKTHDKINCNLQHSAIQKVQVN
jgi:hypothetical protein